VPIHLSIPGSFRRKSSATAIRQPCSDVLPTVLDHLEALVAFDTRAALRARPARPLLDYIRAHLPQCRIESADHGEGVVSILAVRGQPRRVFAASLDTTPAAAGWTADPLRLRIANGRAVGLGVCDAKGAAAALLAVANAERGDFAMLFHLGGRTSDGKSIAARVARERGVREAIVAGPTRSEAVIAHRGASSILLRFRGNASRHAKRWRARARELVAAESHARFGGLAGLGFEILDAGDPGGMGLAAGTPLRFGLGPLPTHDVDALHARFGGCAAPGSLLRYEETLRKPSLPAGDAATVEERRMDARDLADGLDLPIGNAVDFWTPAALFSQAGLTAIAYGPGDIAQAGAADESLPLAQLQRYAERIALGLATTAS
jgi:acetylornithine deacetylase